MTYHATPRYFSVTKTQEVFDPYQQNEILLRKTIFPTAEKSFLICHWVFYFSIKTMETFLTFHELWMCGLESFYRFSVIKMKSLAFDSQMIRKVNIQLQFDLENWRHFVCMIWNQMSRKFLNNTHMLMIYSQTASPIGAVVASVLL